MVAHRKNTTPPKAYVPSSWVIVLTAMIVIGAAGWLGWLLLDDDDPADVTATPSAPAATKSSANPSPSATPKPSKTKPTKAKPTKPTPSAPSVAREAPVAVLNNSGVVGAARAFSGKVTAAGWTLSGIGNWTGSIPANTIYYPSGLQAQAELLADDVDIERVLPSVAPMRMDRLTIILSGPQ